MPEDNVKNKKKNNRLQQLLLVMIFLIGLSIFLYPIISNAINDRYQSYAIDDYDEEAARVSYEEKERMKKEAEAYNESLKGGAVIIDPFGENRPQEVGISYMDMLNVGETMGHLEIPTIGVDLPIYHGTSEDVLYRGVGHIEQTSLPIGGASTNSVLTGHRGLPTSTLFRNLNKMKAGDIFYIHTLDEVIAYQVFETIIVLPTDIEKLKIEDNRDLVTLVTCDPYMINSHRLLVRGERIPYEPVEEIKIPGGEPSGNPVVEKAIEVINHEERNLQWLYIGTPTFLGLSVLGYAILKRRRKDKLSGDGK